MSAPAMQTQTSPHPDDGHSATAPFTSDPNLTGMASGGAIRPNKPQSARC